MAVTGHSRRISASTGTLLIVDDDAGSRELLARRFHRVGYRISSAPNGLAALEAIRAEPIGLVLLDCMMPEMDGFEVLGRIRQTSSASDLPVIMVTGRDSGGDIVRALAQGANDYLTKPVDFAVALARVTTHLELRQAQKDLQARMEEVRQLASQLQLRNDFIKQVFGRYVTNDVVESVLETPGGLALGGQKCVVTILMSDLRGFTGLSEQLAPEQVVEMLNVYLGAMAEVITGYRGLIDEFIGDAILAVFGAPVARDDHAEAAVACALAMQIEMERVNRRLHRLGVPPLEMGIGINTGEVVIGNIGSDKRAKYGVVGTHVNLAGRIQSATVGGEVLLSETTAALLEGAVEVERSFTFNPKGASKPLTVCSAVGLRGRDHLKLARPVRAVHKSANAIPVRCFPLNEHKVVASEPFAAELFPISEKHGALRAPEPLPSRTDLKLETASGPSQTVYCKVMGEPDEQGRHPVEFTSTSWPLSTV
jgi:class 3 adenylate cyclase